MTTTGRMSIDPDQLLRYDEWANGEIARSLRAPASPPPRALEIFAHIAAVHQLFLSRILTADPVVVWPSPNLNDAEQAIEKAYVRWKELLTARRPDEEFEYVNSKGEHWRSRFIDIVTHVVLHSAYHRGQIAALLGAAGATPPNTDFIHASRARLI